MTNIFPCGFQTFQTLIRILVIAFDIDPDFRGPSIVGHLHSGHAHQSDPRIRQFAFDQRLDLLAQGFAHPPAMIF